MHTIRLPTIAFRLRNRFLLRQRFSNSSASSSARRKKKQECQEISYIFLLWFILSPTTGIAGDDAQMRVFTQRTLLRKSLGSMYNKMHTKRSP
jgi:hypothetical protein